jgi:signal transduction histidine kinase
MKIRTQFYLLVTGILTVPFLVAGLLIAVAKAGTPERSAVPGYREAREISGTAIDERAWEKIAGFIERKPNTMDFVIVNDNSRVIFSTIDEITQSQEFDDDAIMRMARATLDRYLFQFDSPPKTRNPGFFVITRIERESLRRMDPMTSFLMKVFCVFIALLACFAVLTVIIARSITSSILELEKSTRRIAAGELDLVITAKGNNEITSLTDSLNRMRLSLKDDQNRRARFIMGVSHDLKTPLALIKGYTEAISDGIADDPESIRRSLDIVGTKVNQLEGMIDDLIGFVKLDTGEWRKTLESHNLAQLLRQWSKRIAEDGNVLGKKIETDVRVGDDVTVPLDEKLFVRALDNIVNNAFRYTTDGGIVHLTARVSGGEVRIAVRDDGPGIAEADIPHIFDLFYRGTNSRREEGMGLGLSVVKSVADSHGWKVEVESKPGSGSTFTIVIPHKKNADGIDLPPA